MLAAPVATWLLFALIPMIFQLVLPVAHGAVVVVIAVNLLPAC